MKWDLSREELEQLIENHVIGYPHCGRDREMLKLHLFDGQSYSEIAEKYKMSNVQVARRLCKAEKKLFSKV